MFLKLVILGLYGHQSINVLTALEMSTVIVYSAFVPCAMGHPLLLTVVKSVPKSKQVYLCSCKITICLSFSKKKPVSLSLL